MLMDSLALAVCLKQPTQKPSEPATAPKSPAPTRPRHGRVLASALAALRHVLSRDARRPCH